MPVRRCYLGHRPCHRPGRSRPGRSRIVPSIFLYSLMLGATALAPAPIQARFPATCATAGERGPHDLHRAWILQGWEYHPGDPRFSFREKLGRFYDWSARDVLLFDDFDPQCRRLRRHLGADLPRQPVGAAHRQRQPRGCHGDGRSGRLLAGIHSAHRAPEGRGRRHQNPIRHRVALPGGRLEDRPRAQFVEGHSGRRGRARSRA